MKKILVVFSTAFVRTGGLTSVMMNYWRAMDKTGISFDFASTNDVDNLLLEEISKEESSYIKLPPRNKVLAYFNALSKLCRGYDIVHVHANSATSIIELLAAKTAGVPKRIHHNHTSKTQHPIINALLHPLFIRTVTDPIACSDAAGEWLFGRNNYLVLPNAIDIEKYRYNADSRQRIRKEFQINDDEFVIGHIGKFMDAKNHEFLINVFAAYHTKRPKSKLILVGDGAWRSKIETWVANSGCPESIVLAGMRSDIPDIVQSFDVFVFPSIYEGLPLTVLEAQSSGLPCFVSENVTRDVGIGEDCMFLSISEGPEIWVSHIESLNQSSSREDRCLTNQRLITEAGFNIHHEADKLRALYETR